MMYQFGDGGAMGGAVSFLIPLLTMVAIFYVLVFAPMQRQRKKQQQMLDNLKTGDRVVTTGGLRGTVVSIKDNVLHLRVPPQDVRLEIVRSAIATVEPPEK